MAVRARWVGRSEISRASPVDRLSCDFAPGYPETMLDAATVYLNQSAWPHDVFQMVGSRRLGDENARALPRALSVIKQPRLSTLPDQL